MLSGDLWAAGIKSDNFDYSYGYLEISAKLPGFYNNGEACGQGFWPTFWTYYLEYNEATSCWVVLDEIDILEPSGDQYADADVNVVGIHDDDGNCGRSKYAEYELSDLPVLFDDYHKYAVEWLPNRMIFYFDDEPFGTRYYDTRVPANDQRVLIDLQLGGGTLWLHQNTPIPSYMSVDYFRYYTLDMDCNNDATITTDTQLDNFDYQVKRNITIGNGSSNISLASNEELTFRATNNFTINGNFTIPSGAALNLIYTPCH